VVDVELYLDVVRSVARSGVLVADSPVRADDHLVVGVNVVLEAPSSKLALGGVES
jgi:hypothetical protein